MPYLQSNEPYHRVDEEKGFNYGLGALSVGASLGASAFTDFKGGSMVESAAKKAREKGNPELAKQYDGIKERNFQTDKSNPNYNKMTNFKSGKGRALNYGASALAGVAGFLG